MAPTISSQEHHPYRDAEPVPHESLSFGCMNAKIQIIDPYTLLRLVVYPDGSARLTNMLEMRTARTKARTQTRVYLDHETTTPRFAEPDNAFALNAQEMALISSVRLTPGITVTSSHEVAICIRNLRDKVWQTRRTYSA